MSPAQIRSRHVASTRRTVKAAIVVAVAVLLATVAPVLAPSANRAVAAPQPHGTTVRGTASGDHAWDPKTKKQFPAVPSVTVDQTRELTDQVVHVTWKNFTPSKNPTGHFFASGNTYYAVTVLECKGLDPKAPKRWLWPDFGSSCYDFTADNANAANGVGNQAYTLTGPKGTGETYFHVETSVENDFLGCDERHPCSLVVVPNWGGMQPSGSAPGSSDVNCADHTADTSFIFGNYALDNTIGQACSWSDRIVVPLHFAPTPSNCPNNKYAFASEGAPNLARTVNQWRSKWCTGKNAVSFDFDAGTNEYLARSSFLTGSGALTSATDVAVVNQPATPGVLTQRKFAYAPLTDSAISVAYHIDNLKTGRLITHLTLDARLVAKLVTQSYSLAFGCVDSADKTKQGPDCDPGVKGNPVSIFDDPEFQKLNPEYDRATFPSDSLLNRGQFLPLVINGDSDMVHELTAWIESDKQARDFVAGKPDQWGMHVNTYYKHEEMPLDLFQNLDPGYTAPPANNVPGQSTMQVTWNPITGMDNVAASLITDRPSGINPTLPPCGVSGIPCVYQRFSPEPPGQRALFAVVGLVDSAADRFPSAQLVNAAGKAVGPSPTALRASLAAMKTNPDGITQTPDYAARNAKQYPLPFVNYAMVPTCGLPAKKVSAVKAFLDLAAASQHVGLNPGQLSPGAIPLSKKQLAQTRSAASKVSTTACVTKHPKPKPTHHATHNPPPPPAPTPVQNNPVPPAPAPAPSSTTSSAPPATTSKPVAPQSSAPSTTPAAFGIKHSDSTIGTGLVLPLTLTLGLLLFIGGPLAYFATSGGAGAGLAGRLRRGLHR